MSQALANILTMRMITGVSALILFFAVGALDSPVAWWVVVLAASVSLAALFVCTSARTKKAGSEFYEL